jgi:hypothetical protein
MYLLKYSGFLKFAKTGYNESHLKRDVKECRLRKEIYLVKKHLFRPKGTVF